MTEWRRSTGLPRAIRALWTSWASELQWPLGNGRCGRSDEGANREEGEMESEREDDWGSEEKSEDVPGEGQENEGEGGPLEVNEYAG